MVVAGRPAVRAAQEPTADPAASSLPGSADLAMRFALCAAVVVAAGALVGVAFIWATQFFDDPL